MKFRAGFPLSSLLSITFDVNVRISFSASANNGDSFVSFLSIYNAVIILRRVFQGQLSASWQNRGQDGILHPETMKALVKQSEGKSYDYVDVPIPKPKDGELLVHVNKVAICGSDIALLPMELRFAHLAWAGLAAVHCLNFNHPSC